MKFASILPPFFVLAFSAMGATAREMKGDRNMNSRKGSDVYISLLNSGQGVGDECASAAIGNALVTVDRGGMMCFSLSYQGLIGNELFTHIHGPAMVGEAADAIFVATSIEAFKSECFQLSRDQEKDLEDGLWYFNIHSDACPGGEIRGQILRT
jgi:hypothetical protein